jgi:site-specific recombinase XerD
MNNPPMTRNEQKLLQVQRLRDSIRAKGYSDSTNDSYCRYVGKFIDFLCDRSWPTVSTSRDKVEAFLTAEAKRKISSSTQNAAMAAIIFYYEHVRKEEILGVDALRAKTGERVRQAPSREDTRKILIAVQDTSGYPTRLICHLMYACGLRIGETLAIRLKDIDLTASKLTIIAGKGNKDRFINLPSIVLSALALQVQASEAFAAKLRTQGIPWKLPHLLAKKFPAAPFQRRWAFLFPLDHPCADPHASGRVGWHCLDGVVQNAMRDACKRAGVEAITPHHLRHAWATHSADAGANIRDIQEILGHRDIHTTMRYIRPQPERVPSPLESLGIAI